MNKASLIDYVATAANVTKKDARVAVDAVINGVIDGLASDGKVALVGFGTFLMVNKKARVARNPKTGEAVDVPAKIVPKFRASASLKDALDDVDVNEVQGETEALEAE